MNIKPTFDGMLARVKSGEVPLDLKNARALTGLAIESGVFTRAAMQQLRDVAYRAPHGDAVGRAYTDKFAVAGEDATYNRARENLNPPGWSDLERSMPALRFFAPANFIAAYTSVFGGDGRAPYVRIDASVQEDLERSAGDFVRERLVGREAFENLLQRYPRAVLDETGHVKAQPDVEKLFRDKFCKVIDVDKIDAKEPLRAMREYLDAHYRKG